jgi:phage tail protein X
MNEGPYHTAHHTGVEEFDKVAGRVLASYDGNVVCTKPGTANLLVNLPDRLGYVTCAYAHNQDSVDLCYRYHFAGVPDGIVPEDIQHFYPHAQNISIPDIDVVLDRMTTEMREAEPAIEAYMREIAPDSNPANPDDPHIVSEQGQWIVDAGDDITDHKTYASFRDLVIARELSNLEVKLCLDCGECCADNGAIYLRA